MVRTFLVFCFSTVLLAETVCAQTPRATTRMSAGPYHVGVPVHIEVSVTGFEEEPRPDIEHPDPDRATLTLVNWAPRTRASVQIINGQMKQWRETQHVFRYTLTPSRTGQVTVGPFRLSQGTRVADAPARTLEIGVVPASDEQSLELVLPDRPLWVGEEVPVRVRWRVSAALAERLTRRRTVRVPLFDLVDVFRFSDAAPRNARTTLRVETRSGPVDLPAQLHQTRVAGANYHILEATRVMTPLKPVNQTVAPAVIDIEEMVRWQRNVFGERMPVEIRRLRASTEPVRLVARAPPANNRPRSFAGIVGTGFSIEVNARPSVVNAGDPINVELLVRGTGALDTLALPPFEALGLPPEDFSVPDGPLAGLLGTDGAKRFRFPVRPLHERVSAIPALSLSWFDANAGEYRTATSKPVALSVNRAQQIGAADVVVRDSTGANPEDQDGAVSPVPPTTRAEFSNLAIETRAALLDPRAPPWITSTWALGTGYAIAALALLFALWWRAERLVAPELKARRRTVAALLREVQQADSAGDLGNALRAGLAELGPPAVRGDLDAALAACDAVQFGGQPVTPASLDTLRVQVARAARGLGGN